MLMSREPTPQISRRRWFASLRVQALAILVVITLSLLVPFFQIGNVNEYAHQDGTWISLGAMLAAAWIALGAFRRVTAFPGTRGFSYILPAFSTTFGVAVAVLLGLRLPYSGSMMYAGFIGSVAVTFFLTHWAEKYSIRRFYLVPTGNIGIVSDTPDVEWILLKTPELPNDPQAAIVADLRSDHSDAWERLLAHAAISGHAVYHTKQLRESLTGRVQLEHLSENSFGSLLPNLAYRRAKRAIDIIGCLLALPLLMIPMMLVAAAIRFDSSGPALFRQRRMGYRGKTFNVLKFRTMRHCDPQDESEASRDDAITVDLDGRITRFGRFLRRSRIDELPQLWNVLKGEMSVIGPRPEAVSLSRWYDAELPFYVYRHIVRPGITGWAQVNQGHVAALEDVNLKLHYDFYYIKNFSAWLDILIVFRTVGIILTGFGSK